MKVIIIERYYRVYKEPRVIECEEFTYHALNKTLYCITNNHKDFFTIDHVVDLRMKGVDDDGKK